jgi:hypothetical protein
MAEQDDQKTISADRQIAREALLSQVEERRREEALRESIRRREARDERAKQRRKERLGEARKRKAARRQVLNKTNDRVRSHVSDASRSLRAALQDASSVSVPRHSEEGRNQQRVVRALQDAIRSLRRVGASRLDSEDFDVDLDVDLT